MNTFCTYDFINIINYLNARDTLALRVVSKTAKAAYEQVLDHQSDDHPIGVTRYPQIHDDHYTFISHDSIASLSKKRFEVVYKFKITEIPGGNASENRYAFLVRSGSYHRLVIDGHVKRVTIIPSNIDCFALCRFSGTDFDYTSEYTVRHLKEIHKNCILDYDEDLDERIVWTSSEESFNCPEEKFMAIETNEDDIYLDYSAMSIYDPNLNPTFGFEICDEI